MGRARFRKGRLEGKGRLGMVLMAGGAAGAVMLSIPNGLLELAAASSGLSEMVPAASPPLGLTARLLIAGVAGISAMGTAMALQRPRLDAGSVIHLSQVPVVPATTSPAGVSKMGFAFSKLTEFARGRSRSADHKQDAALLPRRSKDMHPDAPPRRPIFASEDFGTTDIFGRHVGHAAATRPISTGLASVPPVSEPEGVASPGGTPLIGPAFNALVQQVMAAPPLLPAEPELPAPTIATVPPVTVPAPTVEIAESVAIAPAVMASTTATPRRSVEGLSLTELADRFEAGLSRRADATASVPVAAPGVSPLAAVPNDAPQTLAQMPPAQPVPVQPMLDAEIDEQLRAALGTLQKMTARAR